VIQSLSRDTGVTTRGRGEGDVGSGCCWGADDQSSPGHTRKEVRSIPWLVSCARHRVGDTQLTSEKGLFAWQFQNLLLSESSNGSGGHRASPEHPVPRFNVCMRSIHSVITLKTEDGDGLTVIAEPLTTLNANSSTLTRLCLSAHLAQPHS